MKRVWCSLIFALFLTGIPLAFAEETTLPKPGVLGEETIYTTQRLAAYTTIIINDFDVRNAELENIDGDQKKDIEPIRESLAKIISSNFVNELKSKGTFQNVLNNSNNKKNAVILEGKITKLSGGHGAAKFFLGWMAPQSAKTRIEVTGRLIDAKTGKELAVFSDIKSGATGATMGFLKEVLVNLAGEEGKDIAGFVGKLY